LAIDGDRVVLIAFEQRVVDHRDGDRLRGRATACEGQHRLARLAQVLFGARLHPVDLNLAAALVLTLCFAAGFASGWFLLAAAVFSLLYGAGNGILTITRGTLPLVLFDHRIYGTFVGKLLVPSFLLSAISPFAYAAVIEAFGVDGALYLSVALAGTTLAGALGLKAVGSRPDAGGQR
jgi:hypothetical protein